MSGISSQRWQSSGQIKKTELMKQKELRKGKIQLKNGQQVNVMTVIRNGAAALPKMIDKDGKPVDHVINLTDCYMDGVRDTHTIKGGVNRINWYIRMVVKKHNRLMRKARWQRRLNNLALLLNKIKPFKRENTPQTAK